MTAHLWIRRSTAVALAAATVSCAFPSGAIAEPSVLEACFAPGSLPARPGEKMPVKSDRRFDTPATEQELASAPEIPAALLHGAIRRVELPPDRKLIALTFDLCEQRGEVAGYDGAIVDYLRANAVRATFFAGGKWLRSHDARARQLIADPLFEIANHGEAHRNLRLIGGAAIEAEILGPQRAYEAIRSSLAKSRCAADAPAASASIAPRLSLFRFPYGACDAVSLAAVNRAGLVAIQWDVSTGDPAAGQSAKAVAARIVRGARSGSIVLAHANGRGWHTAEALSIAVPKLKALGYRFVTVSELLAAGRPVVVPTCYDRHLGDTNRYDNLLGLKPVGRFRTRVRRS